MKEKDAEKTGMEDGVSKYEAVEELADGVLGLMEELYQSGFGTVHDSTLRDLQKAAERTENFGMLYLSRLLSELQGEISAMRHRMETDTGRMTEVYADICEYLYICRQKAAYDRGLDYYS